jgi:HlyD family secretion protein
LRFSPAGLTGSLASSQHSLPPGEGRVWVMENENQRQVSVKLGLDDDAYTEVVEGALTAGDTVIVGGQPGSGSANSATVRPRLFGF